MSRSTRDQPTKPLYKPFPIQPCIKGVYLKNVRYAASEAIRFEFRKGDMKLVKWIGLPNPERVKEHLKRGETLEEAIKKKKNNRRACIEDIFSVYLGSEGMKEFYHSLDQYDGFKGFSLKLIERAEKADYQNKEIWLKTIPSHKGVATLPYYPPIASRPNDVMKVLEWDELEQSLVNQRKIL